MANVGFGLTQLDILGSGTPVIESSSGSIEFALGQGTPKIESTTGNLELKATEIRLNGVVKFGSATITIDGDNGFINTGIITANNGIEIGTGSEKVAISTNLAGGVRVGQGITFGGAGDALMTGITTVGKELQVGTGITISSGIITAINAIKVGTGITISSGVVTATSFSGGGNDIVTSRWDVVGGGTYAFTGPGGLSSASQPKIYLARGQTYEFVISNASSHPFQIQQSNGTVYNTGVTNNGSSVNGVVVKFEVPFSAPNSLQYVCTVHSGMGNTIIIYPDLSP